MTEKDALKKRIQAARGEIPADLVIRGCQVVNVFDGQIRNAEIAVTEGVIVGVEKNGTYEGREIVDGAGMFAIPGLIESHIHIESSHLTPEEFGRVAAIRGLLDDCRGLLIQADEQLQKLQAEEADK